MGRRRVTQGAQPGARDDLEGWGGAGREAEAGGIYVCIYVCVCDCG